MSSFGNELYKAKYAENIAKKILDQSNSEVEDLTNEWEKYGKMGDFRLTMNGQVRYIDIKDDKVIHRTKNVFVEKKMYRWLTGKHEDGWYYADYHFLGIVSRKDSMFYIIDFKMLKKKIELNTITHKEKLIKNSEEKVITTAYIISLDDIKKCRCPMIEIKYDDMFKIVKRQLFAK